MITDQELLELRQRNDARAKLAKEALGDKWLLHKSHSPKKLKKNK